MAGSRTLKLSILADVDNLKKELDKGSKEVEGFGGKLEKFSAAAKAAFAAAAAAAAAYAVKLAVDGVKAAIEDEAAQKRLETALKNVTDATDAQVKAVEAQILKTSLATGVADDKLRPAFQRLAIATGDLTKSQELLQLALDISASTGKDVETVSNALGKAYEGNTGALTRLGIGLSAAEIKTLGLEGAITTLSTTFGGAAAEQAETFEGKMARVRVAFDEAKESLGAALLPVIEQFFLFITETAIPKLQQFKETAIDPVIKAFKDNEAAIKGVYNFLKDILVPFLGITLGNSLKGLASVASFIVKAVSAAVQALEPIINAAIAGLNAIIKLKNLLTGGKDTPTIGKVDFSGASSKGSNTVPIGSLPSGFQPSGTTTTGTTTGSLTSTTITPTIPSSTTPSITQRIVPSGTGIPSNFNVAGVRAADEVGNIIINVNAPSVVDREGFSRAVVDALNESNSRNGGGGGGLRGTAQVQ